MLSNKSCYLIRFNYSKIKNIANIVYKKFRTNSPRFNQNHSYMILIYLDEKFNEPYLILNFLIMHTH
jgi:hypothetical protein